MHNQIIDMKAKALYGIPSRGDDSKAKSLYEQYLRVVPKGTPSAIKVCGIIFRFDIYLIFYLIFMGKRFIPYLYFYFNTPVK